MVTNSLSLPSNSFEWSRKTSGDHSNTETDAETDADHKRFFTHKKNNKEPIPVQEVQLCFVQ